MKLTKVLALTMLGMSLLVGCGQKPENNGSDVAVESPIDANESTDSSEEEVVAQEETSEIKVLTDEEIKAKMEELKTSGNIGEYVATAILSTQVTSGEKPYNIKDYDGNLINCEITTQVDGQNVEIVLSLLEGRETIDIEQLETLVYSNLTKLDSEDYSITLLVNDTIVGNFNS